LLQQGQGLGSGLGFTLMKQGLKNSHAQLRQQVIAHVGTLLLGTGDTGLCTVNARSAQLGVFNGLGESPALAGS
jgi:hypothetical protein